MRHDLLRLFFLKHFLSFVLLFKNKNKNKKIVCVFVPGICVAKRIKERKKKLPTAIV